LRVTANVPEVVMGDPVIVSSDGTVIATLVTVPVPLGAVLQFSNVPVEL
jgi:antitoxin (DNA-binding transcriptional repressor) of toxin-antitoxin stability system